MSEPILWVLVGLSGSGKSSYATELAQVRPNTDIISTDRIREELTGDYTNQEHNEEVFKIFHNRIRYSLEHKRDVIADATNLTMKSRRAILQKVNGLNIVKVCLLLTKPFQICKIDNLKREHPVSGDVLKKQISRFQIPFIEEGFDEINIIQHSWEKYKIDMSDLLLLACDFKQKTPYRTMTLERHCMYTGDLFDDRNIENQFLFSDDIISFCNGAFLHDIGKIVTQTFDEHGIAHYYNHAEIGSYMVLSLMRKPTKWNDKDLLNCCFLINYHMMPFNWDTDKAKQKWKKRFGLYKYNILAHFHVCDKER